MEIFIKAQVDRTEGRQLSAELVGDELAATIEGESLDVEDSVFEVTSAEAVAGPKQATGAKMDDVLLAIDAVFKVWHEANPLNLDDEDPKPWTDQDRAIIALQSVPGIGPAILEAKTRAAKR